MFFSISKTIKIFTCGAFLFFAKGCLLAQTSLLGLDDKGQAVAVYANKLVCSQFDSGASGTDILVEDEIRSSGFLDVFKEGTTTKNYMQAAFFIIGDVRGAGTQLPYRVQPIKTDGKRIIWGSNQSVRPVEGFDTTSFVMVKGQTGNGHSEPQFVQDMQEVFTALPTVQMMGKKLANLDQDFQELAIGDTPPVTKATKIQQLETLVKETLRTDPKQFAPFLTSGGNSKIRCYGFSLTSLFDICPPCLGSLNTFITDQSRCSLHDFMSNASFDKRDGLRSKIVVNSAFPYIGARYQLDGNGNRHDVSYTYNAGKKTGVLSTQGSSVTTDVTWDWIEKNTQYSIICRTNTLFLSPNLPKFNNGKLEISW